MEIKKLVFLAEQKASQSLDIKQTMERVTEECGVGRCSVG
jgi:hypothetical protein